MYLITRCAISRKDLKESDDVVSFPFFESQPNDPEFICCEDIALRSEFEKWYLRDKVIKKVRDLWVEQCHERSFILILAENENYLIIESIFEKGITLFFLNHVFRVDFTDAIWKRFGGLILATEQGNISTMVNHSLNWVVDTANGTVSLQIRNARKDSIVIPIAEWLNLQELLSVSR